MNSTPQPTHVTIQSTSVPIVLHVWLSDPAATTVVFYPGTMSGAGYYRMLLEQLVGQGFNVVGLNPLSHGDSPHTKYLFTFDDIVQNGKDAVIWARQHTTGPVVLAGHSQGGIAALAHLVAPHAAQAKANGCSPASSDDALSPLPDAAFLLCTILPQHPRAIELTIFAPFAPWHTSLLRGIRSLATYLPWLPIMIPMYLSLRKIFRGGREAVRPHGSMRAFYPLTFIASLFSADLTQATRKGGISCPVSLITACNDALFTPDLLYTMWDAIKAPVKQRVVLEGGGHMAPFVPRYAAEIAAHMAKSCTSFGFALSPTAHHE